ncbi:hypothetical protein B0J14DRAFT_573941 [Halenospora varia]|nr:hypothetical protein B0J14DRAFT_573941 [Halenospora varia]
MPMDSLAICNTKTLGYLCIFLSCLLRFSAFQLLGPASDQPPHLFGANQNSEVHTSVFSIRPVGGRLPALSLWQNIRNSRV